MKNYKWIYKMNKPSISSISKPFPDVTLNLSEMLTSSFRTPGTRSDMTRGVRRPRQSSWGGDCWARPPSRRGPANCWSRCGPTLRIRHSLYISTIRKSRIPSSWCWEMCWPLRERGDPLQRRSLVCWRRWRKRGLLSCLLRYQSILETSGKKN